LTVNGATTVNGLMSADGYHYPGTVYYTGSGGSVYLTTATLSGSGTIRANGGTGTGGDSRGGGGRVAVILTNGNSFGNITFEAFTGAGGRPGAPGTIYKQTMDQGAGNGDLIIAADTTPRPASKTLINSNVTSSAVGTVIITNLAPVVLTNQTLTVNGDWRNTASFVGQSDSAVELAGTAAAQVIGNNTFFDLTSTASGKTLSFEAGKTTTVDGKLTWTYTTLLSTSAGSQWFLTLTPGATQEVTVVTVRDSNAGGGQTIIAEKIGGQISIDLGNNVNWSFIRPSGSLIAIR
jgi:hypothetical protein